MTIILPTDYHAQRALENNDVICINYDDAVKADIRPLRIGLLNIMPEAQSYEFCLLHPLGRSILQIIPVWIKLESHKYTSTSKQHLDKLYVTFDKACTNQPLDGMIITGAPVEKIEFKEVNYWPEIKNILLYCQKNIPSTLGLCWGAMALAYMLGIEKQLYDKKFFGIFETINLNRNHPITGSLDDRFWMPQSRHAGYSNDLLEEARDAGIINLLAKTVDFDYTIFESYDRKFLMNLGHFEYDVERIIEEFQRDKNIKDVEPPKNFNLESPVNLWRSQRNEFYQQWLRFCHEETHKKY